MKIYKGITNKATYNKWRRMVNNVGWSASTRWIQVGFADWTLEKDENGDWIICAKTNYHVESTLDEMYKSNFKKW